MAQEKQAIVETEYRTPRDTAPKSVRKTANEGFATEPAFMIGSTTEHLTPLPDQDSPPKEEIIPIPVDPSVLGVDDVASNLRSVSPRHLKAAEAAPTTLSYFFPADTTIPNWDPISMSAIYLTILATTALAAAIGQEFLLRHSQPHDGLISFRNPQSLSTWQYFLWRYFPTILTILYGIAIQATDFKSNVWTHSIV